MITDTLDPAGAEQAPDLTGPVLRNAGFLKLWIAQLVSQTAQNGLMFTLLVLITDRSESGELRPLYEVVALRAQGWNSSGNLGLVAGATYPEQTRRLRGLCPELPFLVPGVGAQGAALVEAVQAARFATGGGYIVNASRGVLYASEGRDFAEAARREALALRDAINEANDADLRG